MLNNEGQKWQDFQEALISAFPIRARLNELVQFKLDKNLAVISEAPGIGQVVFELIQDAEARGYTERLLVGAREAAPGNAKLYEFAQQFQLTSVSKADFEANVKPRLGTIDIMVWREQLGKIESRVCCVRFNSNKGTVHGSGFLIGPDLVMTNYHVIDAVLEGEKGSTNSRGVSALPEAVTVTFDYKVLPSGQVYDGRTFKLAEKWLVASSPFAPCEETNSKSCEPSLNQLDYAVLRIAAKAGSMPVGKRSSPEDTQRGWLQFSPTPNSFVPNAPIAIVQHPQDPNSGGPMPLQLAFDTDSIIGLNGGSNRVRYKTNTDSGSSGSPCFDLNWNLVALHHSGDTRIKPQYNEGIPFEAIMDSLEKKGLKGEITQKPPV